MKLQAHSYRVRRPEIQENQGAVCRRPQKGAGRYYNAVRYFKNHLKGEKYSTKKLNAEREGLAGEVSGYKDALGAIQEDVKILRDVRRWLNQVLPPEQYRQAVAPGEQPSIQEEIRERQERARREQARKRTPPPSTEKTGYGTLSNQTLAIFIVRMTGVFCAGDEPGGYACISIRRPPRQRGKSFPRI